jgi:PAS domain S-box-containing protein
MDAMSRFMIPAVGSTEEAQALLAAIVSSSDDAIISKDLNGVVRSWNQSAERIFGYTTDEMVGQSITVLFPPDRIDEEPLILERLKRGERVDHFETIRVRKDGTPIAISVTISPIRDKDGKVVGASKVARDITQAAELEGRFKAIVSSSDDAIISKDLNGVVRSWNQAAERIFGYTAAEMVGNSITTLFPADRMDEEPKILDHLRRGQRVDHFETVRRCKDGRLVDVSVTISPVKDLAGRVIGVSKVARDITGIKRYVREREELLERAQAARADAELAGHMKDEFLATLSHELRTPLSAILGWSQILRRGPSKPEVLSEGLATIERNARAQTQIIDDLLDMSRIISGKISLKSVRINLTTVLRAAIETVRSAAAAKGISIVFAEPLEAQHPILGDVNRLQQVFWNLLSNAIKFTARGGVVHVSIEQRHSAWQVDVIDSGEGISADFLPFVFDRFRQADASTTRRHGGLGLGLAIVKQLVELHGGGVRVRSEGVGRGSTFTVSLPVSVLHTSGKSNGGQRANDEDVAGASSVLSRDSLAWESESCENLRGLRVVVVDDEPDARALLKRLLNDCGATVLLASSAAEAVELVERERPDVLVSDIGMPHEDGYKLLQRVRALGPSKGGAVPAIALTAYARAEDRVKAVRAGFQMHVPKPVEPTELVAMIETLAGRTM